MTEMLSAALSYSRQGRWLITIHTPEAGGCSCKRLDCNAIGKHPRSRHGLKDAFSDETNVRELWERSPNANIGIVTGSLSGIVVVDADNRDGGNGSDNLAKLAARYGGLPVTLTAITGNGRHLYFRHPGGTVKNSVGQIALGVDVKADGGYVVAPPSLHKSGERYRWEYATKAVAEMPEWLLTRITAKKEDIVIPAETAPSALTNEPTISVGERNDTLFRLGCALRGQQAKGRDEIMTILFEYNEAKCEPPLDEQEVIAIVQSVCQHPAEMNTDKSGKRLEQCPLYWFPWNTREWFSDQDIMLTKDYQVGWHVQLMALAWDGAGYLTADREKLWKLAKAKSAKVFKRDCDLVLAAYEEVEVNGLPKLRHRKLTDLFVKTAELWMKKKVAGLARKDTRLVREVPEWP